MTRGRYQCVIRNAHGVPVPDHPLMIDLGEDADSFAKTLIDDVRRYSGSILIDQFLGSMGTKVAGKLPPEFWTVLQAVAAKVADRPVTLQLNSAEPYVPWELARVKPALDATRPSFLGAQVIMGRWIIGDGVKMPPRGSLSIRAMAIMVGMYNVQTGLRELPEAKAEAKELLAAYESLPAIPLQATENDLYSLLKASLNYRYDNIGGVEAVHFAGHGEVDPTRPGDAALYLSNGMPLDPILFLNSEPRNVLFALHVSQCLHGGHRWRTPRRLWRLSRKLHRRRILRSGRTAVGRQRRGRQIGGDRVLPASPRQSARPLGRRDHAGLARQL